MITRTSTKNVQLESRRFSANFAHPAIGNYWSLSLHVHKNVYHHATLHLWDLTDVLHSLHCAYPSLRHNWNVQHSDDELDLRRLLVHVLLGLLELLVHEHKNINPLFLHPLHNLKLENPPQRAQYLFTALGWRWTPRTASAAQERQPTARPAGFRRFAPRYAADPAPADQTRARACLVGSPRRQAPHPRPSQSTRCQPLGEEDSSGSSP